MGTFKAIRIDKAEKGTTAALTQFDEAELMEGDVTVAVEWSTVNYKDGLALTGKSPVVRRFPMIAGVDFAGTVLQSSHPDWKAGDKVVSTGWGLGETHLGAYAEKARVKGDWLVRLPDGMTTQPGHGDRHGRLHCNALGARSGEAWPDAEGRPDRCDRCRRRRGIGRGGAAGEAWLSRSSPRPAARPRAAICKDLGAAEIIDRNELSAPAKPLAKERWAGGIDSVGSTTLANLLSMTKYRGAIAACGLAGGMDLPSSVAPFILRGVCLLGIDSVMCPIGPRKEAWARLAKDLDHAKLAEITQEIRLEDVFDIGPKILAGQVRGRLVVKIS